MLNWFLRMSGAAVGRERHSGGFTKPERPPPCCASPSDHELFWGMDNMPVDAATTHFVVVGSPGSGKTVSIQLFLQSIAHRFMAPIDGRPPERLVIFDPKRDVLSFLGGLGLTGDTVTILNPFDARSVPWDMAQDIPSDALAKDLAARLIPEEKQSSAPFFWRSSREVVEAVILAIMETRPGKWTFRDLLNALANKERISALIEQTPLSKTKAEAFLLDVAHFPTVLSHIASNVGKFGVIAALWHNSPQAARAFTLDRWIKDHGVLVLGHHPTYRESIAPINSMLLRALTNRLLDGPEVSGPRTWIVLDEFRWMESVDCVRELLNQGRSKGVSVLLGVQDLDGLYEVYGQNGANEILGQCANKSFLRVGSASTAAWGEYHFAQKEEIEYSESWTYSEHTSHTVSASKATRPVFLRGEFLELPDPRTGIFAGIHDLPRLGGAIETRELSEAVFGMLRPRSTSVPNEKERPASDQRFTVWTPEEEAAFLPGNEKREPEVAQTPGGKPKKSGSRKQGVEEAGAPKTPSPFERLSRLTRDQLFRGPGG